MKIGKIWYHRWISKQIRTFLNEQRHLTGCFWKFQTPYKFFFYYCSYTFMLLYWRMCTSIIQRNKVNTRLSLRFNKREFLFTSPQTLCSQLQTKEVLSELINRKCLSQLFLVLANIIQWLSGGKCEFFLNGYIRAVSARRINRQYHMNITGLEW